MNAATTVTGASRTDLRLEGKKGFERSLVAQIYHIALAEVVWKGINPQKPTKQPMAEKESKQAGQKHLADELLHNER